MPKKPTPVYSGSTLRRNVRCTIGAIALASAAATGGAAVMTSNTIALEVQE